MSVSLPLRAERRIHSLACFWPAVVELARDNPKNPDVPIELRAGQDRIFDDLFSVIVDRGSADWDEYCFEAAMACIALKFGKRAHAQLYLDANESDIPEFYKAYYGED